MAEPFGDKDQAGKRPAQTIDGTATEISVEPGADGAPESEPRQGETPHLTGGGGEDAQPENGSPPHQRFAAFKGFMTHLAAGLLGGVIGVAALALAWSNLELGKQSESSPDIAMLEQRIAKLEAAPPAALDPEALTQLESRIAALEVNSKETPADLVELQNRVAQLESSLKAMAEAASEGGSVASAAAISQQIAEAEQRLDEKLAAARAEGENVAAALGEVQTEIAALKAKLGALAEAELGAGALADLAPELNALSDRLAKLETTLPELVGALGREAAGAKSAAVAIAFANLRAAVSDGRPYAAELDTIGALAPALGDLGILPAYAEKGIPTLPELARSFEPARDNALAGAAPAPSDSLFDRLWASAEALVTVRRIDEAPAGEGTDATLARAKAALDKGDLETAVKEVETLDGLARESFSAWLGQARARLGADAVLARLERALLVSMSSEAQQQP